MHVSHQRHRPAETQGTQPQEIGSQMAARWVLRVLRGFSVLAMSSRLVQALTLENHHGREEDHRGRRRHRRAGRGLVRAILADRSGGFAARAITRNPDSEKAQALGPPAPKSSPADVDDPASPRRGVRRCLRRLLRHQLLGALLARAGAGPGPQHGAGGQGRRAAARDLVHAGGHPQVGAARATTGCRP